MTGFLLDTHTWLWVQQRDAAQVSAGFFSEVEGWQRAGGAYVSAISVLEIARLEADGQLDLGVSVDSFLDEAVRDGGLKLLALSTRILIDSTRLPGEIHRDPSDRLLAATARTHGLTLVTRDKRLIEYSRHGHLSARKP